VRLLDATKARPAEYFCEQPWGQVPIYKDDEVQLFESGAILIHLGLQDDRLLPTDTASRMRGIAWLIAALNSVEPAIFPLLMINVFNKGEPWTEEARPKFTERLNGRLKCASDALGDKEWLEDRFTIGDLMFVTVLRQLRSTGILDQFPNLAAFVERGESRPAFERALSDQLAVFREHEPEGVAA
jgi:glutathione S-transferase